MDTTIYEALDLLKEPFEWWSLRAYLIAHGLDEQIAPGSLESRIELRKN